MLGIRVIEVRHYERPETVVFYSGGKEQCEKKDLKLEVGVRFESVVANINQIRVKVRRRVTENPETGMGCPCGWGRLTTEVGDTVRARLNFNQMGEVDNLGRGNLEPTQGPEERNGDGLKGCGVMG